MRKRTNNRDNDEAGDDNAAACVHLCYTLDSVELSVVVVVVAVAVVFAGAVATAAAAACRINES